MSQKYNKTELFIKKINYQAERLDDGLAFFDFYDPAEQKLIERELHSFQEIAFEFYGGHNQCERKMLCVYSRKIVPEITWPISLCKAEIDFEADHRMVLGAIMQLGINREIIGDIIIKEKSIQVVTKEHIVQYIAMNLQKLKNRHIYLEVDDISALSRKEQRYKSQHITVSSFRIDAIISAAYGISRESATEIIKKRGVKINHEEKIKPTYSAQLGDLFSVKGKGRFVIEEFTGTTKKDKNRILIKKYM